MKNITNVKTYKILAILLCVALAFCIFPQIVKADVLPMVEGDFFMENYADCEYINRSYVVASVAGEISAYESPLSTVSKSSYKNGEELKISYTYLAEDGILWGATGSSWVVMDNLSLIYDSTQFKIDYKDNFTEYDGEIYYIETAYAYTYPNSGDCYLLTEYPEYMAFLECIESVYTDENGNEWGSIGYYRGTRNIWICITDFDNANLNTGAKENLPSQASVNGEDTIIVETIGSKLLNSIPTFAIAVVVVLVAVSIILIVKTKKK
ncbi:MAG: hypothetical protein R3Y65_04340 [Bacillota bacterium]